MGKSPVFDGQGNRKIGLSQFAIDDLSGRGRYKNSLKISNRDPPMNAYLPGGTPSLMVPAVLSSSPSITITRAPGFT